MSCTKNTELAQAISAKFSEQKGYYVENNRINQVLKEAGFAMSEPKKWHRKKLIRYERECSNSLWHVDWHEIKDPSGRVYG
ncbi:MAG: hypothetical protein RXR30_02590 [Nitrososphaeria archaeon]